MDHSNLIVKIKNKIICHLCNVSLADPKHSATFSHVIGHVAALLFLIDMCIPVRM